VSECGNPVVFDRRGDSSRSAISAIKNAPERSPHKSPAVNPGSDITNLDDHQHHYRDMMNDIRSIIPPSISPSAQKPLKIGDTAPILPLKLESDKPAAVAFIRHIGCPFAEKTFRDLRAFSETNGGDDYQYLVISHGKDEDTRDWIQEIGGAGRIKVISDPDFEIYGEWVFSLAGRGS
jgi:hypothetical protein